VLMSSLMGKGFQLSRLSDVEHIYLLATGSGISPLKAVIESPQFQQLATKKVCLCVFDPIDHSFAAIIGLAVILWGAHSRQILLFK